MTKRAARTSAIVLLSLTGCIALLTACGGSSSSSSSSASEASGTTGEASATSGSEASGAPIVVGTVVSASGPLSWPYLPEFWEHYEGWINESGGINGHPLEIVVKDDGGNSATANKVIRELVENEHVQAIVGDHSINEDTWGEYLASKGVPCVGCAFFSNQEIENADFYPTGQNEIAQFYAAATEAKALGAKKIAAYYCAESPACAGVAAGVEKSAELIGIEMVAGIKVSSSQPSYTPACLAAKNAGAEAIYLGVNPAVTERVIETCDQQKYEPINLVSTNAIPYNSKFTGWNHAIEIVPNGPVNAKSPYAEELHEVLGEMLNGSISNDVSTSFAGMQMFRLVAEREKLGPGYTSKELTGGLQQIKDETLKGGAGPITYTKGTPTLLTCYFPAEFVEGNWNLLAGEKPVCPSIEAVTEVLKALG